MSDFRKGETAASAGSAASSLRALGSIIRRKRRASSLRIDDAAALCGVSVDLMSRLENGKSGVSTERVLRVLDGLGLAMLILDKEEAERALAAVGADGR